HCKSLIMVSTRACPFHCNWCAKPIWGQRYAMRSPANVAEELALVKQMLRPDHIWFADDIFGLLPQWGAEFRRGGGGDETGVAFYAPVARRSDDRAGRDGPQASRLRRGLDGRRERQPED